MCRWGAPQLLTCHVTDRDDKAQPIAMVIAGISRGCVDPDQRIIHCGTVPIQHSGGDPNPVCIPPGYQVHCNGSWSW